MAAGKPRRRAGDSGTLLQVSKVLRVLGEKVCGEPTGHEVSAIACCRWPERRGGDADLEAEDGPQM